MIVQRTPESIADVVYPESDGKPLSDNTKQMRWITVIYDNLSALYRGRKDVFVAGDLLWYPIEGCPEICAAPDALVVIGRPRGDRGSYMQWREDGVPPQVVFEILSPYNDVMEMADKLAFYDEHGVEEYYLYDPEKNRLAIYVRQGTVLVRVRKVHDYVSPRLGIRFDMSGLELVIYHPNGQRFRTYEEVVADLEAEQQQRQQAEERVVNSEQRATNAEERAARLAEKLRQAGIDPDA